MSQIFSELNRFLLFVSFTRQIKPLFKPTYHFVPKRCLAKVIICSGAINEMNAYPTL